MQHHKHNRRKYLLLFPVIFAVKYRKSLLNGKIKETLKRSLNKIASESAFSIVESEVGGDHLHMMIDLSLNYSISQVVRRIKQRTTSDLWKNHQQALRCNFWKEKIFWSDGYFASSIGNASIDAVKQ